MDPVKVLERLRECAEDRDLPGVYYAAADLLQWLLRGGFVPEVSLADLDHIETQIIACADLAEDFSTLN